MTRFRVRPFRWGKGFQDGPILTGTGESAEHRRRARRAPSPYQGSASANPMSMDATSARVPLLRGARTPLPLPLITSRLTAQAAGWLS